MNYMIGKLVPQRDNSNAKVVTRNIKSKCSVPARPISEGAAPCPYCLAPCSIYARPARIKKNLY